MAIPFTPKTSGGAVPFKAGGSVSGAASSYQAPKRNLLQKAAGVVFDPIAQAGQDIIAKPLSRAIVSGVEAFQSPEKKARLEASYQKASSMPYTAPVIGTPLKPLKDITLESTVGDVAQSAASVVPSAKAAGALYLGGAAMSENKGPVAVIANTAIGAIAPKVIEGVAKYGWSKISPLVEKGITKYGQPFLDKISEAIPAELKSKYQAMAAKATSALDKLPRTPSSKASDKILKGIDTFSEKFDKGYNAIESKVVKSPEEKVLSAIQKTEENMTKNERKQAIDELRAKTNSKGETTYEPTKSEKRAAGILVNKLGSDPVKNVAIVRGEIATRGAAAEKYLDRYAKPVTQSDFNSTFKPLLDKAKKTMTKTEFAAFKEQAALFNKQLPEGNYTTADLYRAVKKWESEVADRLPKGKDALLDPNGSAKQQALSDLRATVRDLIGKKHPLFKSKMFDLASLYEAKDTAVINAEARKGNYLSRALDSKLAKRTATAAGVVAGGLGVFEGGKKAITGSF